VKRNPVQVLLLPVHLRVDEFVSVQALREARVIGVLRDELLPQDREEMDSFVVAEDGRQEVADLGKVSPPAPGW
jgi:hypothetical protein